MTEADKIELAIKEAVANDEYRTALDTLIDYALPVLKETAQETLRARKAMDQDPVDTFTLSNKLVELSILNQRIGDRVSLMGYIVRGCKEYYERTREGHKVRLVQQGEPRKKAEIDKDGKEKIVTKYLTVAAGVADSMKVELAHKEFTLYNECELMMDKLVYCRKSTDKTIDSARSKLSFEKTNEQRG